MNSCSPLWTVPQACEYLQICKAHFYSLIRNEPSFPRPIRLGQTVRFRADDFVQFVETKINNDQSSDPGIPQKRGRGRPRKTS